MKVLETETENLGVPVVDAARLGSESYLLLLFFIAEVKNIALNFEHF